MDHILLYHKLKSFRIEEHFLKWLFSFLIDRTQAIKISFYIFTDCPVLSGVPQSSLFGLLLVLIFINYLLLVLKPSINILLFTDDTKIFCKIRLVGDQHIIQANLNNFILWIEKNVFT